MISYKVRIKEMLERTINIKADNQGDAIKKAQDMYKNEEIVLMADDCAGTYFCIDEIKSKD